MGFLFVFFSTPSTCGQRVTEEMLLGFNDCFSMPCLITKNIYYAQ